ncbi:MAG: CatA-like O-acetyltransferase [Candidatus Competibacteraceae bacterium]
MENFTASRKHYTARLQQVKACPDQGQGETPEVFFITNIPWVSFTAMVHPYDDTYGSIPNVAVGKYVTQGERLMVPIGIQVHHGVVDGIHVGHCYQSLAELCQHPADALQ